jgi:hypothetical protein
MSEGMWEEMEQRRLKTKYRLTVDLTRYRSEYVVGTIGIEGPEGFRGFWGRSQPDRFFPFLLPSGECLDILWQNVEEVKE